MPTIDEILMLLKNNKWCDVKEITEKVEVSNAKLENIVTSFQNMISFNLT